MKENVAIIILAAGKSTRMKSETPKVCHPICSRPMLGYVLDLVKSLKAQKVVAVLGYKHEEVRSLIPAGIKTVLQKKLLGTADAVKEAYGVLKGFKGTCLILYGDNPLLTKETIKKLLEHHRQNNLDATLLTAVLDKPEGYGRILRDKYASIRGIIEDKDADDCQKDIKEINTGIACFKSRVLFDALRSVKADNRKKEYYLTDAIGIIYKKGGLIDNVRLSDINEALGINSRVDLSKANSIMQARINEGWMKNGVSIVDQGSTFIGFDVKIGRDTVIYPFTVLEKGVRIGKRCSIGPFAHLRESAVVEDGCLVGNFLEIVRSKVGSKTLIKHFGYIGDTNIGKGVNIGAGTVTANFDGAKKNATVIKQGAFVGSDTVMVAPVVIGRNAVTGAGSVVTKGSVVPDNTIVAGVPARQLKKKKG